eukprot:SAG22_NODE_5325_length_1036_cov_1.532551_3_plen_132_part_01
MACLAAPLTSRVASLSNNGKWPAAFVGAAYPTMLDLAIYEGMGAPGKEYAHDSVMLARSAWAGSQKYGSAVWSGDTQSTWHDFNQQFKAGLNMVMSGIPYWTTDIGVSCPPARPPARALLHPLASATRGHRL